MESIVVGNLQIIALVLSAFNLLENPEPEAVFDLSDQQTV